MVNNDVDIVHIDTKLHAFKSFTHDETAIKPK